MRVGAAAEGPFELVWKDDEGYERRRRELCWHERVVDRRPRVIARPRTGDDVVAAVRLAREHGLRIGVRSGGHSWINAFLEDDAMVVDLSLLDSFTVSPEARTALLEPAVENRKLIAGLAAHGLAFPVGHCPSVPVGGYLLAGGFGWNSRIWGAATQSVTAVDVVLADGRAVRADAGHEPDLYWLARGSGVGFPGIVTRFHVTLQSLPVLRFTQRALRVADLDAVADWLSGVVDRQGRELEIEVAFRTSEDTGDPEILVTAVAFGADPAAAARTLDVLDEVPCGATPGRVVEPVNCDFDRLYAYNEGLYVAGARYAADAFSTQLDFRSLLRRAATLFAAAPAGPSFFLLGAEPAAPPAYPLLDLPLSLGGRSFIACYAVWEDAGDDKRHMTWLRAVAEDLDRVSVGRYVGEADLDDGVSGAETCFAPEAWERVQALRSRFDPAGVFVTPPGWRTR